MHLINRSINAEIKWLGCEILSGKGENDATQRLKLNQSYYLKKPEKGREVVSRENDILGISEKAEPNRKEAE